MIKRKAPKKIGAFEIFVKTCYLFEKLSSPYRKQPKWLFLGETATAMP